MRSSFVDRVKYCAMQIKQIAAALENFAPLPLQEGYDNAGLQCGLTASECSGALLCLDVTEAVVQEAVDRGYNLIVAHHPLLFRGLKRVSDSTYVERTLRKAIQNDVAIYAAHTNLDNAKGGVNYEIAQHLGLQDVEFLEPIARGEQPAGSGLVGNLPQPMEAMDFLRWLKQEFKVENVHFSRGPQTQVQRIAFCGGAGDFLIDRAKSVGADIFFTGEIGYHYYFGHENEIWLAALGHYQSERYTIDLLQRILKEQFPTLPTAMTTIDTNPIQYL